MTRTIVIAITILLQAAQWLVAREVTVAAAISLKEALTACATEFEKESKTRVNFSFGGSGELAAQIEQGAPIDLFISAAQDQIDQLDRAKVIDGSKRVVVARNRMVLIVPAGSNEISGFADLRNARRIAIGQPKTVPAGKYASQVLERVDSIDRERLVYGTNVRQVLDYVERGEVSAGLVYQTDAMIAGDKVRVVAMADQSWHEPIVYPAVIVPGGRSPAAAEAFLRFLRSDAGQKILERNGFLPTSR